MAISDSNIITQLRLTVWAVALASLLCLPTRSIADVEVVENENGSKEFSIFDDENSEELFDENDISLQFRPSSQLSEVPEEPTSGIEATMVSCSESACYRNRVMPSGLLFKSYIAAPHEPRFSSAALFDNSSGTWRWDATLGSRVGLFRRERPPRLNLDAWQIDIEGAAMVRLDPQEKMDLESGDYRFGLLWTGKRNNFSYKFGYYHVSSHVGDEYLIKNPTFQRINYVKESLILGTSFQASPELRLYGEVAVGVIATGGAEPLQFQFGAEYARLACCPTRGAPFIAVNAEMRQEVDFTPGVSILTGWQWKSPETGKAFRIGLQFFNGPSNQYQFFEQYDNQLGLGVWYDF